MGEGVDKYYHMVVLSQKKLLLDDASTDLVIKIGNETVHAHAAIVSCRCQDIIGFPQDEKSKKRKKHEIKIKDGTVTAAIMNKVLEYLYTGQVDFPKLSDNEILQLGISARHFNLGRLVFLCEKWLIEHMTIESVFHLLKAATDLNESRMKGFCLGFALQHYNEFISNKDGIKILGIDLFQEVVAAFQTNPPLPQQMKPEDHPDTLLTDFKKMYDVMPYSDCSFQLDNETIRCHKAILTAQSDAFNNLFRDDSGLRLSATAFKSMLKFFYYGDDHIEPLPACELVAFSRTYKLPSLNRICEEKIRDSVAIGTVLSILSVSYLPAGDGKQDLVEELRAKCYPFILSHLSEIDFSRIRTYNPMMIVDLLFQLQGACKKGEYGLNTIERTISGTVPSEPRQQSSSGLLGAQRSRPPPPPRNDRPGGPPVPPREKSQKSLPPPSLSTPNTTSHGPASDDSEDTSESSKGKKKGRKDAKPKDPKRPKKEKKLKTSKK